MRLQHILLLCLFVGLYSPLVAQENSKCDSLIQTLDKTPHDITRLQTLRQITKLLNSNVDRCRHYNEIMLEEAERQKNNQYKCEAYYTRITIAYNTYNIEELNAAAALLEPLARREKRYDMLFKSWRCRIDFLILTQDYERNEKEALKMLREAESLQSDVGILEAYQSLANIYRSTFRRQQAADILEKARSMAMAMTPRNEATIGNICQTLLFVYEEMHDYPNWIRTLKLFEAHLNQVTRQSGLVSPVLMIVYSSYLSYYSQRADWPNAEKYRILAEALYSKINSPLYCFYFDYTCANYYDNRGEYNKALTNVERALYLIKDMDRGAEYYNQVQRKADLLCKVNRAHEAIFLYKEVAHFKDSIGLATIDKQYRQLRKDFNADQLFIEQAQLRHRMQLVTLILLGCGLLLVLGTIFYLLRNHRFLQKAEHEMRQMTRLVEQVSDAKDHFLSNINISIRTPLNTVVEGALILASRQMTDPIERQQLSEKINSMTNGLLMLINDILDLSRLEAEMMKFDIIDVEITSMIFNAITAAENNHETVKIESALPKNTLYMIRADSQRLLQVFEELLSSHTNGQRILSVVAQEENGLFRVCVSGTPLADESISQKLIIRNEINRMLILQFGGTYEIHQDENQRTIYMTFPINEVIRPD